VTTAARVLAQAKVNLRLRILARETSGYHSIETVFLRIDLADRVTVRALDSGRTLDCAGPAMPIAGLGPTGRNLAYRAAVAYADATGWPSGFSIEIAKHIPVGAGLGGGSADAGAVLRCLDALSPNPLGERLPELGGRLGADVPFMTIDSPMALGWGHGDRLLPLPVLASRPALLAIPDFAVSTADAYAWLAAAREEGGHTGGALVIAPESVATWEAMVGIAVNDFDDVICERFPIVRQITRLLRDHDATITMLSGSGSAVFAIFSAAPSLTRLERVPNTQWIQTHTADRVVRVEQDR
jgi:4-diphosphocytidyl-2-C-methyl-D-erythritol kinase